MDDLAAFISARLSEDEAIARVASRDGERGEPADGEHWRWVANGTDEVITPDPAAEFIDADGPVSLRSTEHYPSEFVGPLPHFVLSYVDEASGSGAAHIARHDPARVLREVTAKRAMVQYCTDELAGDPEEEHASQYNEGSSASGRAMATLVLRDLAVAWSDHPDYRPEWAPGHG